MRRTPLVFIILFVTFYNHLPAQSIPWYTQYRDYHGILNPASLPTDYMINQYYTLSVGASYRQEGFANFNEIPVTQNVRAEWVTGGRHNDGFKFLLGGYVTNDQFGATGLTSGILRLAVVTALDPRLGSMSIGFSGSYNQFRIKSDDLYFVDEREDAFNYDPSQSYFDLGFGLFYRKRSNRRNNQNDFYFGLSIPQIRGLNLSERDSLNQEFSPSSDPGFYIVTGIYLPYSDEAFWEPSIWIKKLNFQQSLHMNFNLRHQYRQVFWVGGGFGIGLGEAYQRSIHAEFGVITSKYKGGSYRYQSSIKPYLKIGAGFDYYFSKIPAPFNTALEINIAFVIPPSI